MKLVPDQVTQPEIGVHPSSRRWLAIGGIGIVVVLAVIVGFVFYGGTMNSVRVGGGNTTAVPISPQTPKQLVDQMSVQASTTIVVTPAEKQQLINQMSQLASSTGTTAKAPSASATAPAPAVSPAEQQKLFDAMQKKVQ